MLATPPAPKRTLPELARATIRQIGRLKPVLDLRRRRYDRHFSTAGGDQRLFRGVYPNFAAAAAAAPPTRPIGYDNESSAHRLEDERHHVFPSDYPVLFWLDRLIGDSSVVFDLGGNVGSRYFGFRNHLAYPAALQWVVYDLEAVVALGRTIAAAEDAPHLSFTTEFTDLARADILFASGVLQFIEHWIGFLEAAPTRPTHVLINRTPITQEPSAVTLQATGVAFCPYHLFNRDAFIAAFARLGYRMVDEWTNPSLGCYIPTHPQESIEAFSGYYFRRDA